MLRRNIKRCTAPNLRVLTSIHLFVAFSLDFSFLAPFPIHFNSHNQETVKCVVKRDSEFSWPISFYGKVENGVTFLINYTSLTFAVMWLFFSKDKNIYNRFDVCFEVVFHFYLNGCLFLDLLLTFSHSFSVQT